MKARDIALLTVTREISGNVQVVSYFEMTASQPLRSVRMCVDEGAR